MKKNDSSIILSNMFPSYGQQIIEVAKFISVQLFFEEPIGQIDIENGNPIYFQVKKDNEISIITLTVNPNLADKRHTNITIISAKGNIYSYVLVIVKNPSMLSLKVKEEDAVFNLKNGDKNTLENKNTGKNNE